MSVNRICTAAADAVIHPTSKAHKVVPRLKKQSNPSDASKILSSMDAMALPSKVKVVKVPVKTKKGDCCAAAGSAIGEQLYVKLTGDKGTDDLAEKFARHNAAQKEIVNGDTITYVKDAEESARRIMSHYAFCDMVEPGLSHKSAQKSAEAILQAEKLQQLPIDQRYKLKKDQLVLKRQLQAKHADKLQ